jgi:CubicO group peptidase (beta-lactamase class C family)
VRVKRLLRRLGFFLFVALPLAFAGSTPPMRAADVGRGDWKALDRYLSWYVIQQLSKYRVPGVSIALTDDHGILWAKGFGYADPEHGVRATPETDYQVGSISKVVTATAVIHEVERGRLALDAPIQRYLPEFSMRSRWGKPPQPTLRELLSHHAGLPTYYLKGFFSHESLTDLIHVLKDEYLAYPPRTVFNYSNLGPDIAGAAIERVEHEPFARFMQQTVLDPLGMTHSSFSLDARVADRMARGHVKNVAEDPVTIRDVPAGGLFSNVEDLARFMQMTLRGGDHLVSAKGIRTMMTPQFPDTPLDFGQHFGLGWMLSGIPVHDAGPVVWHNGGTKTFISQMALLPERKLGVVVLANADVAGPMVYETAEEVLKLALYVRDGISQPPRPPLRPEIKLPGELLDAYAGDYSLMGALARIDRRDNRLVFHVLGHTLDLVPVSPTDFRAEFRMLGFFSVPIPFPPVEFVRLDGRTFLLMRDRGVAMTGEKVPPYKIPDAWRRRTGDYRLVNADKDYLVDVEHSRLVVENNRLLMEVRIAGLEDRDVQVVMMPLGDDAAYVFGLGRNVGDVSTVVHRDGKEYTRYSGYLFERVPAPPGR